MFWCNKKTPASQGYDFISSSPHLAEYIRRNWHPPCYVASGLPGFIGPFPSTSLDESSYTALFSC